MSQPPTRQPTRRSTPCEADSHEFSPEVYDLPVDDRDLSDARCLRCGWSWDEIADHDRGDCCCPASHATRPMRDRR